MLMLYYGCDTAGEEMADEWEYTHAHGTEKEEA